MMTPNDIHCYHGILLKYDFYLFLYSTTVHQKGQSVNNPFICRMFSEQATLMSLPGLTKG